MYETSDISGQNNPTHILVADDDPLIREVLKTKLERSGFRVDVTGNGQETLSFIAEAKPDLLVLDIRMPEVDGFEVCRRLRAEEATKALPVLMVTAFGGVDHIIEGLNAGADDYVTKPFYIEEVMVRIRSLLRMRQIERELREKETHLARVETLGQLLVTMAHYINNSLAVLKGRAQALKTDDSAQAQKLKDTCLRHTRRIQAVLESLKTMANQMKISTTSYAGLKNAMLDIEEEISRRMEEAEED